MERQLSQQSRTAASAAESLPRGEGFRGQCQKQVVNLPDYGGYIRGMCSARTVVRVPCHGWIWADIVARKGRPPLPQVRTVSAAGPHLCPGPATVFGLLCILASPVPNKTTDRRRKSHRPGTKRYQTLLGMSIISKNNRVFALSRLFLITIQTYICPETKIIISKHSDNLV